MKTRLLMSALVATALCFGSDKSYAGVPGGNPAPKGRVVAVSQTALIMQLLISMM